MKTTTKGARRAPMLLAVSLMAATLAGLLGCDDPTRPPPSEAVASVTITPASLTLEIGDTITLRAVLRSERGDTLTGHTIAWTSGDTAKAIVTAAGHVKAKGSGSVAITAAAAGRNGQAVVTIAEPPPPVIQTFQPAQVAAGGPGFTLTILGSGFQPDAIVLWNGSVRPTTYVNATQVEAPIASGDIAHPAGVQVRVVNPGHGTGTEPTLFPVVVQQNPVSRLGLRPAIAVTSVGAYVPLTATPFDLAGHALDDRLVTYASSNQLVATVDGSGQVTPVGPGEVVITARSESVEATSAISVRAGSTLHMLATDGVGLVSLDMRLGTVPVRFWQHWPGSRVLEPSPSPDGRYLVYTIEDPAGSLPEPIRQLAILDRANRTYQFLPNTGRADQPAWSPAGDRIAFRRIVDGRSSVFTIRPDGTAPLDLTADLPPGSSALDPAWSPDGSRIVFAVYSDAGFTGLMTMNADGSGKRPLTWGMDTQPSWLGDVVAFTRHAHDGPGSDVWRVSVSGVHMLVKLTSSGAAHSPAWSPDHRWIAYVDGSATGPGAIMAMRPFGEDARPISLPDDAPGAGGLHPVWVVHH